MFENMPEENKNQLAFVDEVMSQIPRCHEIKTALESKIAGLICDDVTLIGGEVSIEYFRRIVLRDGSVSLSCATIVCDEVDDLEKFVSRAEKAIDFPA